jgi:predicted NAD/FAD-dependent oxidoreductase
VTPRAAVVGAGIAGAACARALGAAGVDVELIERGRAPGGRLASPQVHGRRVDLGAAYFTVQQDAFAAVVDDWSARGLARDWTSTMAVLSPEGRDSKDGPARWAAPGGLRSLVRDLLVDIPAAFEREVRSLDDLDHDAVVLAMPDPQAARILGPGADDVDYEPVIAVATGWARRQWPFEAAAFVNDDEDVSLVADDGARRGDGAAVLVAHSTPELAAHHLDDPDGAVAPVLEALRRLLDLDAEPAWTHAHRWRYAKPAGTHGDAPYELLDRGRPVGRCGDSWCPAGSPRVEAAWLSGDRVGRALAAQLL